MILVAVQIILPNETLAMTAFHSADSRQSPGRHFLAQMIFAGRNLFNVSAAQNAMPNRGKEQQHHLVHVQVFHVRRMD